MNQLKEIVDILFDKKYLCESSKESISLLFNVPYSEKEEDPPMVRRAFVNQGVTVAEQNKDYLIIDAISGVSRFSVGSEFCNYKSITLYDSVYLSTEQIATLLNNSGFVYLINPVDAVEIYSNIETYFTLIENFLTSSPHFTSPPKEDIDAFKKLQQSIHSLAQTHAQAGLSNSTLTKLLSASTITASGFFYNNKEKIKLTKPVSRVEEDRITTNFDWSR